MCMGQSGTTVLVALQPPFLVGEDTVEPLPSSLEVPSVFVIELNQEADDEG